MLDNGDDLWQQRVNSAAVADAQSPNAGLEGDRHDVFTFGISEPDPGATMSAQAPTQIDSQRTSCTNSTHYQPNDLLAGAARSGQSQTGSLSHAQDSPLQIQDAAASRRPVESSVWNWDTPLDTIGESASYYYEPQGELLQEHRELGPSSTDFSIPHAIGGVDGTWKLANCETACDSTQAHTVPTRPSSAVPPTAGVKRKLAVEQEPSEGNSDPKRTSCVMSDGGDGETPSPMDPRPPARLTRSQSTQNPRGPSITDAAENRPRQSGAESRRARAGPSSTTSSRRPATEPPAPLVLPARKVFPIQIGDKLFRLSGASISSDAPSYFSQFFEEQLRQSESSDNVRTLYIDRDPATFEDISLHLQGYHIEPRDGPHFVKLFADAQFFSLPRLTAQLFASPIYVRIGDVEFQIPRDLFSNPGDSPNYFSLGFAIFFTTPTEVFPGLNQRTLLRPPSILPPSVPNRSAKTFADLLHLLKGYPVELRSEEHRTELLRDVRYFHLKGLEQRLIPHTISYNLARKQSEILVRLEDIRQSGVSFVSDGAASSPASVSPGDSSASTPIGPGWVFYQRPYVDSEAASLIVEIGSGEFTMLSIAPGAGSSAARFGRATFHRQTLSRITSLLSVIANKMNLPVTQPLGLMMLERGAGVAGLPGNSGLSDERVKVRIGPDAEVVVDGKRWPGVEDDEADSEASSMNIDSTGTPRAGGKRRRGGDEDEEGEEWIVRNAQWRVRVQPMQGAAQAGKSSMEVILGAVKIDAYSTERGRNAARGFLA
ncbi:hypothetical protein LTR91_017859 [Friedmanniomyces endolithicus]|uniref:Potassium channel tetramerisation-type BTB domain-containing protein n=1 Tax=Friedmanniomyces endolithicus TaxID=329885 RepID=A0AAN6K5E9_9PEZI|nr:hypothetical protein LTR59_006393 [Friedmanniomyces endolithicus]KAK0902729.1 hypothetical protein LTR57_019552 [Friedmanniomyces endolithicus]KAK0908418.1 hypothetical protein LTR02_004998 [Friedmanniomyces endolithicus]KAK0936304.1 hypothetical protein LTR29_012142 [Friedmanniomyces endolithicus]KAK0965779.1 hypothetical protein LTR91_017859 [Friedmanniomyces endolithicus]